MRGIESAKHRLCLFDGHCQMKLTASHSRASLLEKSGVQFLGPIDCGMTDLRSDKEHCMGQSLPSDSADIPTARILPQAWRHVASRLEANGVKLQVLERDTSMYLDVMWVDRFRSSGPYEGHHPLAIDSVHSTRERIELYKGDFIIPSNQPAKRYLAEVFSSKAHDAFLVWNFFDAALQRKEYYSSYVFEETAEELLESDPLLRSAGGSATRPS